MDFQDFGREIDSPGRPGGYTTGVTYFSPAAIPRRLALLKEAIPGLSRVGVLYRPRSDWSKHWADIEAAAGSLDLRLLPVEWVHKHQLSATFDSAIDRGVGALLTLGDGATHYHRHTLFELAAARRVPVLYDFPIFPAAEEVGLMTYRANVGALFRTVAEQVDQILKGRKPGDIPVETPQIFRLVINRGAARGLGLELPSSL
jgi:putative ABC transport system substrate-binding protein